MVVTFKHSFIVCAQAIVLEIGNGDGIDAIGAADVVFQIDGGILLAVDHAGEPAGVGIAFGKGDDESGGGFVSGPAVHHEGPIAHDANESFVGDGVDGGAERMVSGESMCAFDDPEESIGGVGEACVVGPGALEAAMEGLGETFVESGGEGIDAFAAGLELPDDDHGVGCVGGDGAAEGVFEE